MSGYNPPMANPMKTAGMSLAMGIFLAAAGCGETKSPGSATATPAQQLQQAKVDQAKSAVKSDDPVQPPDAVWTILCTEFRGYGHVERAASLKQSLRSATGMSGFFVVHEENTSSVNYGYYRAVSSRERDNMSRDEINDGKRAQADLVKIRSLANSVNGDPLFPQAGMSPLEPADPAAPMAWDLRNVDRDKPAGDPTRAFWSLEIAIYKDSPERKQAAVDSVKALREYYHRDDFYFYHGRNSSSVCLGTWPESAVITKEPERGGSEDRVLVTPQGMPDMGSMVKGSDGSKIRPVAIKYEPVDPTMLDAMRKFERRSVNGSDIKHIYKGRDGGTVERFDPSLVIIIPRDPVNSMAGNSERNADTGTGRSILDGRGSSPGGGQLRSLNGSGN